MKTPPNQFCFTVSAKDRKRLAMLLAEGAEVLIDIDPLQGGVFMSHEGASLVWSWMGEIDFDPGPHFAEVEDEADEDEPEGIADAEDAVFLAASIVPKTSRDLMGLLCSIPLDVSERSLSLLHELEDAGFTVSLSLDPHAGGIHAKHSSGARLEWSFITEVDVEPLPEDDLDQSCLLSLLSYFERKIKAARPETVPVQYSHPAATKKTFFVIESDDDEGILPFDTLAEAQRYVLEIAERGGVRGEPEDVLEWMSANSHVLWGSHCS